MTVGELARCGGVNLETIRYYERRGLLPRPQRSVSGYRQYSGQDLRRVRFIKRAQELGFSLREIAELLALQVASDVTCADVRRRAEEKIVDVERKIQALTAMKKTLVALTATCVGSGPIGDCPILESFEDGEPCDGRCTRAV